MPAGWTHWTALSSLSFLNIAASRIWMTDTSTRLESLREEEHYDLVRAAALAVWGRSISRGVCNGRPGGSSFPAITPQWRLIR